MRFSGRYARLAALVLALEVLIALYVHDSIVRPYGGDALAVVALYCLLLAVVELPRWSALLAAFSFACGLELAQYLHLVERLGLSPHSVPAVMIGTVFSPYDLVAYAVGALLTVLLDADALLSARNARR